MRTASVRIDVLYIPDTFDFPVADMLLATPECNYLISIITVGTTHDLNDRKYLDLMEILPDRKITMVYLTPRLKSRVKSLPSLSSRTGVTKTR